MDEVKAVKDKLVDVRGEFKLSNDLFSHWIHTLNEEQKRATISTTTSSLRWLVWTWLSMP